VDTAVLELYVTEDGAAPLAIHPELLVIRKPQK
jgi:hypothetical protein